MTAPLLLTDQRGNLDSFTRNILQRISASMAIPYEKLTGDFTATATSQIQIQRAEFVRLWFGDAAP
jgi:capsid protein